MCYIFENGKKFTAFTVRVVRHMANCLRRLFFRLFVVNKLARIPLKHLHQFQNFQYTP